MRIYRILIRDHLLVCGQYAVLRTSCYFFPKSLIVFSPHALHLLRATKCVSTVFRCRFSHCNDNHRKTAARPAGHFLTRTAYISCLSFRNRRILRSVENDSAETVWGYLPFTCVLVSKACEFNSSKCSGNYMYHLLQTFSELCHFTTQCNYAFCVIPIINNIKYFPQQH
jgi:hypothetical protein